MVGIFSVMLGTAAAQAILPALVFWPLFAIFQIMLWTCVILGVLRKIFWAGADTYTAGRNYRAPENKAWTRYKKQLLR